MQSARSIAFASSRSLPGGVSTTATSSAPIRSSALREQTLGRRLDELDRLEVLVFGALDPLGCARLRVGVDQRRRAVGSRTRGAARYTDVVVFPTPPLSAATTMIIRRP